MKTRTPDSLSVSFFDTSVLINACDTTDSFSEEYLRRFEAKEVAFTLHLFEELGISGNRALRKERLKRLDKYCGVFLNDSYIEGSRVRYLAPSEAYKWYANEGRLGLQGDRYKPQMSQEEDDQFGQLMKRLSELALREVNLSPVELNNVPPNSIFPELERKFRDIDVDIWGIVGRAVADLEFDESYHQKRRKLTERGRRDVDKRLAVMQWIMYLTSLDITEMKSKLLGVLCSLIACTLQVRFFANG